MQVLVNPAVFEQQIRVLDELIAAVRPLTFSVPVQPVDLSRFQPRAGFRHYALGLHINALQGAAILELHGLQPSRVASQLAIAQLNDARASHLLKRRSQRDVASPGVVELIQWTVVTGRADATAKTVAQRVQKHRVVFVARIVALQCPRHEEPPERSQRGFIALLGLAGVRQDHAELRDGVDIPSSNCR